MKKIFSIVGLIGISFLFILLMQNIITAQIFGTYPYSGHPWSGYVSPDSFSYFSNPWYNAGNYYPGTSWNPLVSQSWSPYSSFNSSSNAYYSPGGQWWDFNSTLSSSSRGYWSPYPPPWATGIHAIDITFAPIYGRNNPYQTGGFMYHPIPDYIPYDYAPIPPRTNPDYEPNPIYQEYY